MDRKTERGLQYLALPTAAAIVHIQVVGTPPDALAPDQMRKTLEHVAHSLATLARICSTDGSDAATEIPSADLVDGTFTRGAHLFIARSGRQYRKLVVRRSEMEAAILILARAGVRW